MVLLFGLPKGFSGHSKIIQTNAIKSWTLLRPECEILLFGNEEGTAEICRNLNIKHVPDIKTNEFGTPMLDDIFEKAERLAPPSSILCYVNSDIILFGDFVSSVKKVKKKRFLLVGRRWNIYFDDYLDFEDSRWEKRLKRRLRRYGKWELPTGIDYFVFPKNTWDKIPPFALGRLWWDNWFLYEARMKGIPLINASGMITAVHQIHDYNPALGGAQGIWKGEEQKRNLVLVGGNALAFTLRNSQFILTKLGVFPALSFGHFRSSLIMAPLLSKRPNRFLNFLRGVGHKSIILNILEKTEK